MKARKLGIPFEGNHGRNNEITDVTGVQVGHCTIIKGEGDLVVGKGPVRTGVTSVIPCGVSSDQVFAGYYSYNGNGEMTGTLWIDEAGHLQGPICITNTHSVGVVRDAVIEWNLKKGIYQEENFWGLPVVAETCDGILNDINGFHITKKHVYEALNSSKSGQIQEGNVGGGTGMICHQFKGGIGTSSRVLPEIEGGFVVGALVQTNYGIRDHLTIAGVPVGKEITDFIPEIRLQNKNPNPNIQDERGSIIVIIATDAPLLPYQLKRIAKRVPAGLARVGGYGGHFSGDIFLAFSTANKISDDSISGNLSSFESLNDQHISPLFKATAEATEEAIINALISADTMKGINDNKIYALPHGELQTTLEKYNRLIG